MTLVLVKVGLVAVTLVVCTAGYYIVRPLPRWLVPHERYYCEHPTCIASFLGPAGRAMHELAEHGKEQPCAFKLPPRNREIYNRKATRIAPAREVRTANGVRLRIVTGRRA
jgi:hypothetical protein